MPARTPEVKSISDFVCYSRQNSRRVHPTPGSPPDRVGVRTTTNEAVDAVGRAEAIARWASVLLARTEIPAPDVDTPPAPR